MGEENVTCLAGELELSGVQGRPLWESDSVSKKMKEARERAMQVAVNGKSVAYMGLFCRRKTSGQRYH